MATITISDVYPIVTRVTKMMFTYYMLLVNTILIVGVKNDEDINDNSRQIASLYKNIIHVQCPSGSRFIFGKCREILSYDFWWPGLFRLPSFRNSTT